MLLEINDLAERDIDNLYLSGADQFSEKAATFYLEGLLNLFDLLLLNPKMGRSKSGYGLPVRMIVYRSHVIFYREGREILTIVRVLHAQQNWTDPSVLTP